MAVSFIRKLYHIETEIKQYSFEEKKIARQQRAYPILAEFHRWLIEKKKNVMLKSPLEAAINYVLNHWYALTN